MPTRTHILNRILPMGLRSMLRRAALGCIPSMRHLDMPRRLAHLKAVGFAPRVIFDVGAATGDWARLAARVWPDARVVGFEPNASNAADLERCRRELPHFDFRNCFLGPEKRTVEYKDRGTQTSLYGLDGFTPADAGAAARADMVSLDELVAAGDVPRPDLIKIDVQGFELDVLRGAERVLADGCQVVLAEVNFYKSHPQLPTADEVIAFMRERGFAWYDTAGLLRRPLDDALWQMDLLFVRSDHELRRSHHYADTGG
jgi:FkbM family methyltransferase